MGYFNGNSYLELINNYFLKSTFGTVSAWVKTTTGGTILSLSNKNDDNYYFMLTMNNNSIIFYYWNNDPNKHWGTVLQGSLPGVTLTDNQWHQLVWQSDGSTWTGYIDGMQVTLNPATAPDGSNRGINDGKWFGDFNETTNTFSIGVLNRPSMYGYFNGYIKNIEIFNAIITPTQINLHSYPSTSQYFQTNTLTSPSTISVNVDSTNNFISPFWINIGLLSLIIIIPTVTLVYKRSVINKNKIFQRANNKTSPMNRTTNEHSHNRLNFCTNCKRPININDSFCENCGAPIIKI